MNLQNYGIEKRKGFPRFAAERSAVKIGDAAFQQSEAKPRLPVPCKEGGKAPCPFALVDRYPNGPRPFRLGLQSG